MTKEIIGGKASIGTLECIAIIRGRPPANCAMSCPEHQSKDICSKCYRRPIKETERTFRPVALLFDQKSEQTTVIEVG